MISRKEARTLARNYFPFYIDPSYVPPQENDGYLYSSPHEEMKYWKDSSPETQGVRQKVTNLIYRVLNFDFLKS